MNIVKKIFYFTYRINIKRNDKGTCLLSGFMMIGAVFFLNFDPITHLVCKFFSLSYPVNIKNPLISLLLVYALIAAYLSHFKKDIFIMADVVKDYSPWKRPLVGGGIYILVSLIIFEIVLFVF